jgi:adenylate cyclase class 2
VHSSDPKNPKPFNNLLSESKFRVSDAWQVRAICEENSARNIGVELQTDTYFCTPHGRLQLRESSHSGAFLLSFSKENVQRLAVPEPDTLKKILTAQLGVKLVVRKRREIFLVESAVVNLDDVASLGFFLKFDGAYDEGEHRIRPLGISQLFALQKLFRVSLCDVERRSYYSLRKRADRERLVEYPEFAQERLLALSAGGGDLREVTRTETFVGAYE